MLIYNTTYKNNIKTSKIKVFSAIFSHSHLFSRFSPIYKGFNYYGVLLEYSSAQTLDTYYSTGILESLWRVIIKQFKGLTYNVGLFLSPNHVVQDNVVDPLSPSIVATDVVATKNVGGRGRILEKRRGWGRLHLLGQNKFYAFSRNIVSPGVIIYNKYSLRRLFSVFKGILYSIPYIIGINGVKKGYRVFKDIVGSILDKVVSGIINVDLVKKVLFFVKMVKNWEKNSGFSRNLMFVLGNRVPLCHLSQLKPL